MNPVVIPIIRALRNLWDVVLCQILRIVLHIPLQLGIWRRFRRPQPPSIGEDLPTPRFPVLHNLWRKVQFVLRASLRLLLPLSSIFHRHLCFPPPQIVQNTSPDAQGTTSWLTPKDLAVFLRTNGSDVRCVAWILSNITDSEAVDTAIRLAGTIRWFEDQTDVEPPFNAIVSVFETCFDSTRRAYPGLEERTYYSLRAILWIHALAECKSQEVSQRFPIPAIRRPTPDTQVDLTHLLSVCFFSAGSYHCVAKHLSVLYTIPHGASFVHTQWTSNLLLHRVWSNKGDQRELHSFRTGYRYSDWDTIPLDVTLNRFLIWCILLGSPAEEDVLRIQDKSYVASRFPLQVTHTVVHQ